MENVWTVLCKTAPDDPKQEHGQYSLRSDERSRLYYRDVSHYNWELKDSNCVATITTTQTLTRVPEGDQALPPKEEPEPSEDVSAAPSEPESHAPCDPGAPERLLLRPKWVQLRPGQRACLRATAVDGLGCVVPGQRITWSLKRPKGLRAQLHQDGCFFAADDAAEAEGEFRVIAASGDLRAQALISVSPADLSGIIARRIESGAVSGFTKEGAVPQSPDTSAAVRGTTRKLEVKSDAVLDPLLAAVGGVLVLGLMGALLWLRTRRTQHPGTAASPGEDGELLPSAPGPAEPEAVSPEQWICPTCRRGYPGEKRVCPLDSTELVPYEQFAAEHKALQQGQLHKRCPKCGAIYPAAVSFCIRDGTGLVSPD